MSVYTFILIIQKKYDCNPLSFYLLQFRNVIEPPGEIPQLAEWHVVYFGINAFALSLQFIGDYRLYEKCKIPLEITRKSQDAVGCQILERSISA